MVTRRLDAGLVERGGPVVACCVMPDQVHVILAGCNDIVGWVRQFKASTAAQAGRLGHAAPLWQRRFHDRCLASSREPLATVSRYIAENPVRAGLADRAETWPYTRLSSLV